MALKAQICGLHITKDDTLFRLNSMLSTSDIAVAHPFHDGFIFTHNAGAPGLVSALWTAYESNVHYFEATTESDIFIVASNDGFLNAPMARGIMHAMLVGKPIVLLETPLFDASVSMLTQKIIARHARSFTIANLLKLSPEELRSHLEQLAEPVDYELSNTEKIIIRADLKAHFRRLLAKPATDATPAKTKALPATNKAVIKRPKLAHA